MIKARVFREHYSKKGVAIFIEDDSGESYGLAEPIIFKKYDGDALYAPTSPTFNLGMSAAQILMDDLWDAGLRPSEGSGSAGQLAAVQRHLEDMRKLLSKVPLVEVEK